MAGLNSRVACDGVQSPSVTKPTLVSLNERRAEAQRLQPVEADDFDLDDVFEEPARRGF